MTFTAIQLFPDWYKKGLNKDVQDEELTIRKQAISEILKINEKLTWINLLKVYLGLFNSQNIEYSQIVKLVSLGDDNFQVQSENLVKVISGCAIAQKIDLRDSYISDMLSLGLVCSQLLPNITGPIPDLKSWAISSWLSRSDEKRNINLTFEIGSPVPTMDVKVEIPEVSADQTTWKANSEAVIKNIKMLQKDLLRANEEILLQQEALRAIKQNFHSLTEELNVLWWLFGSYSSIIKMQFNQVLPEQLCVMIAFELHSLTKSRPGLGDVKGILNKALKNCDGYQASKNYTIEAIVNSVKDYEDLLKSVFRANHSELWNLAPILFAIHCRLEFGDEWKILFSKQCALKPETNISCESFSQELYNGLMLASVYQII